MVNFILHIFGHVTNYASPSDRKVWHFYVRRVLNNVRKLDRNNTMFIVFSYQKIWETEASVSLLTGTGGDWKCKSSGTLHSADELTIISDLPENSSI